MPTKKSTKSPRTTARSKATHAARVAARPRAESARLTDLQKPIQEALAELRETSHEFALAGLGMISTTRKQSAARMAELVREGRRVEPKVRKAYAQWQARLRSPAGLKLELPQLKKAMPSLDREEIRRRFSEPARKNLEALLRKAAKFVEPQQA